jgi:hypothetical protein
MPVYHTVKDGECLSSISYEYGFFYETVWNHSANAQLKNKRKNPNTLCPGDVVVVPDKREKVQQKPTGEMHKFQLKNAPALFRLQLFESDVPRADQKYEFTIDGVLHKGSTDSRGYLQVSIPPNAHGGFLVIGPDGAEFDISFGIVQPTDEVAGVQARLMNLGFDCGGVSGMMDDETKQALMNFQLAYGLPATGAVDAATKAKFEELHDSVNQMPKREPAKAVVEDFPLEDEMETYEMKDQAEEDEETETEDVDETESKEEGI